MKLKQFLLLGLIPQSNLALWTPGYSSIHTWQSALVHTW